jgi:hypothetical protein
VGVRRLHRIGRSEIAIPLRDGHAGPPAIGRTGRAFLMPCTK